jgi:hypothetical protein
MNEKIKELPNIIKGKKVYLCKQCIEVICINSNKIRTEEPIYHCRRLGRYIDIKQSVCSYKHSISLTYIESNSNEWIDIYKTVRHNYITLVHDCHVLRDNAREIHRDIMHYIDYIDDKFANLECVNSKMHPRVIKTLLQKIAKLKDYEINNSSTTLLQQQGE